MKKVLYLLLCLFALWGCGGPDIEPTPQTNPKPTPGNGTVTTPPTPNKPTLSDVVDDKTWVDFLGGTWGVYQDGEENKYDSYTFTFDRASNSMKLVHTYNKYFYIYDTQVDISDYKIKLQEKVLLISSDGKVFSKYGRLERISGDEMRLFRIFESDNSYSEYDYGILTKINNTEIPASQVVKSQKMAGVLSGIWKQAVNSIYDNIVFDFSSGKNFYQYSYEYKGAVTKRKYEFKTDEPGIMYYRVWNQSVDPAWKQYFVEVVSDTEIRLYQVIDGKKRSYADFTLKR
jgi:hypothetical protein